MGTARVVLKLGSLAAEFFITIAKVGGVRGDHAHKKCSQLLVCTSGALRIICDDGVKKSEYILTDLSVGLLVPSGYWCKQEFLDDGTVLMVMCDRLYEADDYIHNYDEYKKYLELYV